MVHMNFGGKPLEKFFRKSDQRFYQKCYCCPSVPVGEDSVETIDMPFCGTETASDLEGAENWDGKDTVAADYPKGKTNVTDIVVGHHANQEIKAKLVSPGSGISAT